jgi:hypothetical protein
MDWYLIGSAAAGFAAALGHSYLSEKVLLRPMFRTPGDNRVLRSAASQRVIRWVFHLPSFAWALIAALSLWFAVKPGGEAADRADDGALLVLGSIGVGVYLTGALANLWALRRVHVGNVLLAFAAGTLVLGAL